MILRFRHSAVAVCLFVSMPLLGQTVMDSIVVISSRIAGTDKYAMGTGITISSSGDILTAFHVVQGARSIIVSYKNRSTFKLVSVSAWDTQRDIAILHIDESHDPLPFFPMGANVASTDPGPAIVYGHSAAFYFSQFPASIIHTPIKSREVRDPETNQQIFALDDVDLIPITLSGVYGGLSGGPLVASGNLIGILSGSLNNGGSIGWAIPVSNESIASAQTVNKMPASLIWPDLELMQKGSTYPRAEVSLGSHLAKVLDDSGDEIDALGRALMMMERDCANYRAQFPQLLSDADQALAANPDEDVNSFTSNRSQATSWGDFVHAAGTCFQSLSSETDQQNRTSSQIAEIMPAFMEYVEPLPDTPKNDQVDEIMAQQGRQNLAEQKGIDSDVTEFTAAAHDLETSPTSLAGSREYWIKSRNILDYVVPVNGKGIMRRDYELQKRVASQLNLVFNLEK